MGRHPKIRHSALAPDVLDKNLGWWAVVDHRHGTQRALSKLGLLAVLFVALAAPAARASAEDGTPSARAEPDSARDIPAWVQPAPEGPRIGLEANVGVGTPTGLGGVSATLAPLPALEFSAGAGYGYTGLQVAGMARFLSPAPDGHGRLGIGIGLSAGNVGDPDMSPSWLRDADVSPLFFNAEVSGVLVTRDRLLLRPILGVAARLHPSFGQDYELPSIFPYLGIGVGFALPMKGEPAPRVAKLAP